MALSLYISATEFFTSNKPQNYSRGKKLTTLYHVFPYKMARYKIKVLLHSIKHFHEKISLTIIIVVVIIIADYIPGNH